MTTKTSATAIAATTEPAILEVTGSPTHASGCPFTASVAELELKAVLDAAVDAVIIIDDAGIIETFSRSAERLFGYTAAETVGRNISMLMPEPFRSQHDGYMRHHMTTGERRIIGKGREVVAQRRDGSMFPVFLAVGRIEGLDPIRFVGFIHDVSDRKRVVEALRRERDRAQTYLDLAEVMLLALDARGTISLVNRKGCEILGWPEDELVGRNWFDTCLPEELRDEVRGMFGQFFEGNASPASYAEHEVVTRGGQRKLIGWRNVFLRDERGLVSGTLSSGEDITEQRRAVEALRQSEQLLRDAQALANLGNYDTRIPGGTPYWSPQLYHILELDPGAGPLRFGEYLERCVHPDDQERFLREWERSAAPGGLFDLEYRIRRPDGSVRDVHAIARTTRDAEGALRVVGTLHDITERKRADEEMRQTQDRLTQFARLSTMGEMAAGLAHEINQPLTAITNYAQALRRLMANPANCDPGDVETALQQIAAQALRAGEVIRRLRSFVKNREARTEIIDPAQLIHDLLAFAEPDSRVNDIRLKVEPATDLPAVACDPVQVQQVLLNLIRNAIDAINEAPSAAREITIRAGLDETGAVEISVEDRGPGISPEVATHLGNPFFTTKATGTGLGIAISRSILRAHGGRLAHRPTPGGGATVFFTLPAMPGSAK
jgi:two-component system, LuxR family, sensor kinase FixL